MAQLLSGLSTSAALFDLLAQDQHYSRALCLCHKNLIARGRSKPPTKRCPILDPAAPVSQAGYRLPQGQWRGQHPQIRLMRQRLHLMGCQVLLQCVEFHHSVQQRHLCCDVLLHPSPPFTLHARHSHRTLPRTRTANQKRQRTSQMMALEPGAVFGHSDLKLHPLGAVKRALTFRLQLEGNRDTTPEHCRQHQLAQSLGALGFLLYCHPLRMHARLHKVHSQGPSKLNTIHRPRSALSHQRSLKARRCPGFSHSRIRVTAR